MDLNKGLQSTGMGEFNDTGNSFLNNTMTTAADQTFAANFRNRGTAMTTEELRKARENRATEALRMKDEQLKILSEQNANLLKNLDKVPFIVICFNPTSPSHVTHYMFSY
ncbi:hypothetical protein EON65_02460 [archaeon]|nr:MAG: hypothetical protein EON65_02460 [archaeon]